MINFWLIFGAVLVFGEFILPGLVSVFVGLGALTVALGMYLGLITGLPAQFIVWFISSIVYVFSLRLLVMRWFPSDTMQSNVDEDLDVIGQIAQVIDDIEKGGVGRVSYAGSTWSAQCVDEIADTIPAGECVEIVGRDNITWLVVHVPKKENC
jgi:inner membrane protein